MLVGGVVRHQVDDDPQPEDVGALEQGVEVRERAEQRVDVAVVRDVVAGVGLGGAVERRQPDRVDAEPREVVEPRGDARQVADPVARAVGEGPRIDLIRLAGPRVRDTGCLWILTRKRGHESYVNQMHLVPGAKKRGLIDNKTCSIDDERSGIRFVVPRAPPG